MPLTLDMADIPALERYSTGLYLLDEALGDRGHDGMPVGCYVELFGREESGKTTTALYLAGKFKADGKIVVGDLEGSMKPKYVETTLTRSGFEGHVRFVDFKDGKKMRSHESIAKETADALLPLTDDADVVILDSVASFQPLVEREGDIEEAFMGKRAQAMSKYSRRSACWLRMTGFTKMSFLLNHALLRMGAKGRESPGGDAIKHLTRVRLYMWRSFSNEKPNYASDDGFLAKVAVKKLTFGGTHKDRTAQVFIIPGVGVSSHMTDVFDCISLGIAQRTPHGIKIPYVTAGKEEIKSAGKLKTLIKDASEGKYTRFKRFKELLNEYKE